MSRIETTEELGKHKANYVHVGTNKQLEGLQNQAPLTDDARMVIDFWKREAQLTKLKAVRDMLERDIATLEGIHEKYRGMVERNS